MPAAPWCGWGPLFSVAVKGPHGCSLRVAPCPPRGPLRLRTGEARSAAPAGMKKGLAAPARCGGYFFGGARGLIEPQSADSHLPPPSMVMVSGLPCIVLFMLIFIV